MTERKKLFVGGLSYNLTEDALREKFEEIGEVTSVKIIYDQETERSRGFGFVEMGSEEHAQKAIQELNDKPLDGRNIIVNEAKEKSNDRRGGGGKGFNRGGRDRDQKRW